MKRIARADQLIVVLSDKYLRSRYCMTELYDIYRRSIGAEDDFQSRVNPLVLDDVRINNWEHRVAYAKLWEEEYNMREWPFRMDEMLEFISNKLGPHGFDEIVKDSYAGCFYDCRGPCTKRKIKHAKTLGDLAIGFALPILAQQKRRSIPKGFCWSLAGIKPVLTSKYGHFSRRVSRSLRSPSLLRPQGSA